MPDVTNELIYEVLKSLQEKMTNLEDGQRGIREEMKALRGHQLSMQQDIHNIYDRLGGFDERLERLERRLDLSPAE